jgi:hypothetical protein
VRDTLEDASLGHGFALCGPTAGLCGECGRPTIDASPDGERDGEDGQGECGD